MNDLDPAHKIAIRFLILFWIGIFAVLFFSGCGAWEDITGTDDLEPRYYLNEGGTQVIGNNNRFSEESETVVNPLPVPVEE